MAEDSDVDEEEWSDEEERGSCLKRSKKNESYEMVLEEDDNDEYHALTFLDKPSMAKVHMCIECGSVFTKPSHLRQHALSHQRKSFMCSVEGCERMYTRKDHVTRHVKMDHDACDHKASPFSCTLCHQEFKYKHGLTRHIKEKHDTANASRPYVCPTCLQTFKKKSQLQQHSYVHTGKPPFPCAQCDAAFLKKHQLDAHNLRLHTAVVSVVWNPDASPMPMEAAVAPPVECTFCRQFFASKKTLHGHIQAVHRQREEYPCPDCGNVYSTKPNLNKHIRVIHQTGPAAPMFSCDLCDRSFHYKHVLKKHLQAMHNTPRSEKRKRKPLHDAAVRLRLVGCPSRASGPDVTDRCL
ncbi:hypothetical protein DYB32_003755 [Aphanomyces invadans]|uniref:C2H2-type domain-containing protein n=1 Tax=Aphanomyces invadans TaxID=157072 RepID=A0A3R6ZRZ2_9STRA|nr:hypothetical protein DYB32_003755 [Aphanomyces invadans]